MKKYILGLLIAVSVSNFQAVAAEHELTGKWYGHITMPDGDMLLITTFQLSEDGWSGTLDIPEQGATGIDLHEFSVNDEQIEFSIEGIPGEPRFVGEQQGEGIEQRITGSYIQAGHSLAFSLGREEISPPHVHSAEEATAVIDGHLEAYNAHDLDAFVAWFHPDIEAYSFPDNKIFAGHDVLRASFEQTFASKPHETVLNRIIDGNQVIDKVSVTFSHNGSDMTQESTVIYTLENHKIRRMTFM